MHAAQEQLESEIAATRAEIARLKQQLMTLFEDPGGFALIGDELRTASDRLMRLEADLKNLKLEAREDVWCQTEPLPSVKAANSMRRSSAILRERRAR
jgi:hypothetical protein